MVSTSSAEIRRCVKKRHTDTYTHTCTHTHTHTHAHKTHTKDTLRYRCNIMNTGVSHARARTPLLLRHMHALIYVVHKNLWCALAPTHPTLTHACPTLPGTRARIYVPHTHMHLYNHAPANPQTHTYTHEYTYARARTHTHTHTHAHTPHSAIYDTCTQQPCTHTHTHTHTRFTQHP